LITPLANYISRAGLSDPRPATKGGTPLESCFYSPKAKKTSANPNFFGKPSRSKERGFTKRLKGKWPILILILLSFLTRFWHLESPSQVVFDEVHFGKFVSAYFTHKYYFDIHPPLGKLVIAGFAKIAGFKADFDFSHIGENFDSGSLFGLRFLPALFGSIFVVLIYFLILSLGGSKKAAFFGSFLVLFDNAFLVESKFILLDIFLMFFGFLSLYLFIIAKEKENNSKKQIILYLISAISVALGFSVKWTAFSFLGLIFILIFLDYLRNFKFKPFLAKGLIFTIVPLFVYLSVFAIHFKLLDQSGPGDAFMSPAFQKTLKGNSIGANVKPLSFIAKFAELNLQMYTSSANLKASHPDGSTWYEWPLGKKPIWYWTQSKDNLKANIYLIGNPVIWWFVIVSIPVIILNLSDKRLSRKTIFWIYILLLGFFANILPFVFMKRVVFLYHYLISLVFGILILTLFIDKDFQIPKEKEEKPYKIKKCSEKGKEIKRRDFFTFPSKGSFFLYFGYLTIVFLVFILLLPLSYGIFLPEKINNFYSSFIKFLH